MNLRGGLAFQSVCTRALLLYFPAISKMEDYEEEGLSFFARTPKSFLTYHSKLTSWLNLLSILTHLAVDVVDEEVGAGVEGESQVGHHGGDGHEARGPLPALRRKAEHTCYRERERVRERERLMKVIV